MAAGHNTVGNTETETAGAGVWSRGVTVIAVVVLGVAAVCGVLLFCVFMPVQALVVAGGGLAVYAASGTTRLTRGGHSVAFRLGLFLIGFVVYVSMLVAWLDFSLGAFG